MSYLRGKDFCNCDHARMLREAIERAYAVCPLGATQASEILRAALAEDSNACRDLWNDERQNMYPEGTPLHCNAPADHPVWDAFPGLKNKESE